MVTSVADRRKEKAAQRAVSRSAVYRLLSQALAYPGAEVVEALRGKDLPQAQSAPLSPRTATLLTAFSEHLQAADADSLQAQHRRVFSHVVSADCPPCETFYTARHVFQETQELADIGGFFRAFGLELAEKERLDHISVELEFMHFLTYKEAYALTHHGSARARLCRDAQRKFMRDHLGRWAARFAQRLAQTAGSGYYGCIASLLEAFISVEVEFLRANPEPASASQEWRKTGPEDFVCPIAGGGQ